MDIKLGEVQGLPPLTYGVWITGVGWLRSESNRRFADPRIEYADTALRMWLAGGSGKARIELIDESMIDLQELFLRREQEGMMLAEQKRRDRKPWLVRLWRWLQCRIGIH